MKSSRRITLAPAAGPNTDINVTPLVDVVLVLLIIFMVVTPLLEKDIGVSLPPMEEPPDPGNIPKDQLVVKLLANGDILVNSEKIQDAAYIGHLEGLLGKQPNPKERVVFFLSEDGANYGQLAHLLDGARRAGAQTIGLVTKEPEKQ